MHYVSGDEEGHDGNWIMLGQLTLLAKRVGIIFMTGRGLGVDTFFSYPELPTIVLFCP
jgi:hypothetical protein